jgi:hypothetical protein
MTAPDLSAIRAQLAGITPGPWEMDGMDAGHSKYEMNLWVATKDGDTICDMDGLSRSRNEKAAKDDGHADAAFIAAAPETIARLLGALERVAALAAAWEARGEHDMAYSKTIPDEDIAMTVYLEGVAMVEDARLIRAAITGEGA